ncbi:nucleotide disphospho-sugar-binding domain-containing protein [Streptosporangium sp. LJ11]|uniref:nucleotide disphospho-sugar-binding domain-containing protein n=1 Tax=Streptosporangium sp. LJ11 TaxID=3436927 RepID=UPI003F7B0F6A
MRVLFTLSSWPTHYASMVPLGWALQAAGHEVRVLCAPSQTRWVSAAGLNPTPILDGMDVVTHLRLQYHQEARDGVWPYPWLPPHPVTGAPLDRLEDFDPADPAHFDAAGVAARAARGFDAAVEFATAWRPDLVLHDPVSLEGLLAARVIGVPAAICLWGPVGTEEAEHMRVVPADHSGSFPRHGLGELSLDMIEYAVDPCPPSLAPPTKARRLPVRYVPYNGSGPVWPLPPPDRPRVCVTWSTGLTTVSGPNSYALPQIVEGLRDLDCEVVVTATAEDVAALGPVPPSVRVLERVPLRVLLPTCDAVVHHGGSGTTLTSLWAGVPQLALTFASEQTVAARRTAATGAGLHLLGHLAGPAAIGAAVAKLLGDGSYRDTASRLREEILAGPSPARFVADLEELGLEELGDGRAG